MREYFTRLLTGLLRAATALESISGQLATLSEPTEGSFEGMDEVEARLDHIERTRALWEAEINGHLLKAEQKFKASRAAEERARRLSESYGVDEEGLEDLPDGIRQLYERHDDGGEEEGVQPVPEDVEPSLSPFEVAARMKGY